MKDIVFRRVKANNLIQRRRMDRYISLRCKELEAGIVNPDSIHKSTESDDIYSVTSSAYASKKYEVNTKNLTCTCTVGRTGYPSGESCNTSTQWQEHILYQPQIYYLVFW